MRKLFLSLVVVLAALATAGTARAEMIRELVTLHNAVPIPLEGIGIVTGLSGTGDKKEAAQQLLREYLGNNNFNFDANSLSLENIAIVRVTAEMPPFLRPGQKFPVYVSSIGNAKSLAGGELLQCDLFDGFGDQPVARSTGKVVVGTTQLTRGVISAGQAGGAQLLSVYPFGNVVNREGVLRLNLNNPNWADAAAISRQINQTQSLNPNLQEAVMFAEAEPSEPVAYA